MGFNVSTSTRRLNIVIRPSENFPDWRFLVTHSRYRKQRGVHLAVVDAELRSVLQYHVQREAVFTVGG